MELRQMHYFIALAEHLNFSRAATSLFVAQPLLSLQIQKLERELGVALFQRSSRRVSLTEAGRFLLTSAKRIVAEADYFTTVAGHFVDGSAGQLRIGFAYSVLNWGLSEKLKSFHAEFPEVDIDATQMPVAEQEAAILANRIDIGFSVGEIELRDIASRQLGVEPLVVVLPVEHRLSACDEISLEQLADETFVGFMTSTVHDYITEACLAAGFSPRLSVQGPQVNTMIHMVAAGFGVTLAPRCDCRYPVPGASFHRIAPPEPSIQLSATYHRVRVNPVVERFIRRIESESSVPKTDPAGRGAADSAATPHQGQR